MNNSNRCRGAQWPAYKNNIWGVALYCMEPQGHNMTCSNWSAHHKEFSESCWWNVRAEEIRRDTLLVNCDHNEYLTFFLLQYICHFFSAGSANMASLCLSVRSSSSWEEKKMISITEIDVIPIENIASINKEKNNSPTHTLKKGGSYFTVCFTATTNVASAGSGPESLTALQGPGCQRHG